MFKNSMFMNFWGIFNVHKTKKIGKITGMIIQFLNYIREIPSLFLGLISLGTVVMYRGYELSPINWNKLCTINHQDLFTDA